MRCPFCGGPIEKKPEYNLNPRQKEMYGAVVEAGTDGIEVDEFQRLFFRPNVSRVTVRTTLHRINQKIKPLMIKSERSGTYRLTA